MNHQKIIRFGLGGAAVCLLLVAVSRPWTADGRAVRASSGWAGNSELFLPLVMKPFPFPTIRVSVTSSGMQGISGSRSPSISGDGRYITFVSNYLASNDMNGYTDIYVHDRQTGQTSLISVASDGTQANNNCDMPSISADGRYIVFISSASNLVVNDINGWGDVFIHDRLTGLTSLVSVASDGTGANYFAEDPSISADGRYVVFTSYASNLVSGDTNGVVDIFIRDMQTGQTNLVSVASDGTQGNSNSAGSSISADGRYVAFSSEASNLVSGDTNGKYDIFVHDRQTGQTTRVSNASDGTQGNDISLWPSISADGRYVEFSSYATNLVSNDTNNSQDSFVHDRQTGQTSRVSVNSDGIQGNSSSAGSSISADGRYVAFSSEASNLVDGDTNGLQDVFIFDRQTNQTSRVSVTSDGSQGNDVSGGLSISGTGRFIAFTSRADNLVSNDTNNATDIFVHDRGE